MNAKARSAITWFIIGLLGLALADSAVETILTRSFIGWIAFGVAAIYGAIVFVLRTRANPAVLAEIGLASLFALVAFSGWQSGSLYAPGGLVIARQSAGVVAAFLLSAAIAAAAVAIVRRKTMPIWLRVAVGVLALYAIAPLVFALRPGYGLGAALAGASMPPANPFWLRGAYVGIEILLPLAAIAAIAAAISAGLIRQRARAALLALVGIVMLLAFQIGAYQAGAQGLPTLLAFEHPQARAMMIASAGGPCKSESSALAGIEAWAPGAQHANEMGGENQGAFGGGLAGTSATSEPKPSATPCVPVAATTPAGAANAPGNASATANADTKNVDDAIAKLQMLRGAIPQADIDVGARADALPTDMDAILAFVRDQVRLDAYNGALRGAQGTLMGLAGNPIDKSLLLADLLKRKGFAVRFARGTLAPAEMQQLSAQVRASSAPHLAPAVPDSLLNQLGVDASALRNSSADLLGQADKMMTDAIARAQSGSAELAGMLERNHIAIGAKTAGWPATLKTHYWVQAQRNGSWLDLDPSLPSNQPGKHLGAVDSAFSAGELPDDLFATITLRVIVGKLESGKVTDSTALESSQKVADLVAQAIRLEINPASSVAMEKMGDVATFIPVLRVGSKTQQGSKFDITGSDGSQLASVRFEIQTEQPGQPGRIYRRSIIDRTAGQAGAAGVSISTAWQDPKAVAFSLVGTYDMLVAPADLNATFETMKALDAIIASKPLLTYLASGPSGDPKSAPAINENLFPLEVLHFFRLNAVFAGALGRAQSAPVRFFTDRPDIALIHRGFDWRSDGAHAVLGFDILENGMSAVGSDAPIAARANIARGYMDTLIEQGVLHDSEAIGTPQVIASADASKTPLRVLAPGETAPIKHLSLSGEASENLAQTLERGQAAIVPEHSVDVGGRQVIGWWAVDANDGNAVGRMSGGGGQGLGEYIVRQGQAVEATTLVKFYGNFWRCIAFGVTAPLAGIGGDKGAKQFLACIANAYCDFLGEVAVATTFKAFESTQEHEFEVEHAKVEFDEVLRELLKKGFIKVDEKFVDKAGEALCDKMFENPFEGR